VWDGRTRTLRYARDTTQCVDYFVGLQDFGIWSCFDAGNDEFFRDEARDRYCLLLDHDKCVRGVGASGESVLLRVPGSASCLQLDDPLRPLVSHTCDEQRTAQRWKFDPPLNAFRAAGQPSVCLDYSVDDQAFAVWSCDEQEAENAADDANAGRGFVYHRYSGKYCLRRGRGSTCVMEAEAGSRLLLRRATMRYGCLHVAAKQSEPRAPAPWPAQTYSANNSSRCRVDAVDRPHTHALLLLRDGQRVQRYIAPVAEPAARVCVCVPRALQAARGRGPPRQRCRMRWRLAQPVRATGCIAPRLRPHPFSRAALPRAPCGCEGAAAHLLSILASAALAAAHTWQRQRRCF
jgi:hypothetical protein